MDDWPYRWVRWRDFGLPHPQMTPSRREAHERATTERVEIACAGGIGRIGTALSLLAITSGVLASEAIDFVRSHYHSRVIETQK